MRLYRPALEAVLRFPVATLVIAAVVLALTALPAMRLGGEFMPPLDEGDLLYMPSALPGLSVSKATQLLQQTDRLIKTVPEVERAFLGVVERHHPFIPNDLTRSSYQARITEVREWDEQDFSMPYLASVYGGPVPVRKDSHGRLRAEQSVYRIELDVENQTEPLDQAVTGELHIAGNTQSVVSRLWDRVVAVAIRESGF